MKQLKKFLLKIIKACPLATLLVVTTIGFTGIGLIVTLASGEKAVITLEKPIFSRVIAGENVSAVKKDFFSEDEEYNDTDDAADDFSEESEADKKQSTKIVENPNEQPGKATTEDLTEGTVESNAEVVEGIEVVTEFEGYPTKFEKKKKEKSKYFTDPGKVALTTEYPYVSVGDEYFDDVLFIGDSRVEGLKLYSGLDNAKFYCKEGIALNKILTEKIVKIKINGKKETVSIQRALKEKNFGKIYIMIGINEIGYRDNENFKEKYSEIIEKIKKLQPEAKIVLMGIMKVTNQYANKNPQFSNGNINAKNVMIAELADGKNVFYMDFNPEICDSKGGIKKSYTWDGVHLKAEYYSIWVDFLKKHGFK